MRGIVAGVALALFIAAPVSAAKPQPFSANVWWTDYQNPVEQQTPGGATQPDRSLWVTNPTPCIWDADDQINVIFGGTLGPGETYTFTTCLIGDWVDHLVGIKSERFIATVTIDGFGTSANCLIGPQYDHDADLPPIEGSNGGVGVRHVVTWTLGNPTRHKIRGSASGVVRLDDSDARTYWC